MRLVTACRSVFQGHRISEVRFRTALFWVITERSVLS